MLGKTVPTLIPIGRETPLVEGVLAPTAGVLKNGDAALFFQTGLDGTLATQRFSPFGFERGPRVDLGPLETPSGGAVAFADVAGLKGGGYVAVWGEAFSNAVSSRYAVVNGDDQLVTVQDFGNSGRTSGVAATGLPGGGFALVETRTGILGEFADLQFQRFTAQGDPAGDLLTLAPISSPTAGLFYRDPQAVSVAGGVELLWIAQDGVHAGLVGNDDAFSQRLISAGQAEDLDAARLADGRVVATWTEPEGDTARIVGAVLDPSRPDRAPVEFTVGDSPVFVTDADPQVVALRGGGWAVSWHEGDPDGSTTARAFTAGGVGGREFDGHGDFVGSANGLVQSLRTDADGDVFLFRFLDASRLFDLGRLFDLHNREDNRFGALHDLGLDSALPGLGQHGSGGWLH
jgi:hypothetical protein